MARKSLSDYVDFKQMPTGRHVFALTSAGRAVDALSIPALRETIDAALESARAVLDLELRWATAKNQADTRGDAAQVKLEIVRQLGSLHSILEGRTVGDEGDARVEAADALLELVFPSGLRGLVQQRYEPFLATLDALLGRFDGESAAHVDLLGLRPDAERLKRLTDALREELEPGAQAAVDYEEVQVAREALHEATCLVIAATVTHFAREGDPQGRERVLAELNRQQKLVADARSQHRAPLDVDPETGVVVEPPEPSDPADPGEG